MPFVSALVPPTSPAPALDSWSRLAADNIAQYADAGAVHAKLSGQEMELEADRAAVKLAAIRHLMATTNDLTGNPHSASSAEKAVETDPEYRAYLKTQSEVVVQKNQAYTLAQTARLRSELAIAAFKHEAGLR